MITVKSPPDDAYTQSEIEQLLNELGLHCEAQGRIGGPLRFASLRAPRSGGIYYLAGDASLPADVTDSLILTAVMPAETASGNAFVILDDPKFAFYKLMQVCYPHRKDSGIHPTAIIDGKANISPDAYIGPYCIVESGVDIAGGCYLDSHVVVKTGSIVSSGTWIEPHCTIGATGVAWTWDKSGVERIVQPQTGGVRVGKNVFIGSDISIVRGSVNEATEIGDGTVIAHGTKIGHGCRIGCRVHFANNVSLAGNVNVGDGVFLGSGAVVRSNVSVAPGVVVGAGAVVVRDIEEPDVVVGGVPAKVIGRHDRRLAGVPGKRSE